MLNSKSGRCKYNDKCTNAVCTFSHTNRIKCRFGTGCTNSKCTFDHSQSITVQPLTGSSNSTTTTTTTTTTTNGSSINNRSSCVSMVTSSTGEKVVKQSGDRLPKLLPIPCEHGDACRDMECLNEHENRKKCKNGYECFKISCTFDHSSLVNPSTLNKRQQNKLKEHKVIESDSDDESSTEETKSIVSDSGSMLSDDSELFDDYYSQEIMTFEPPADILDTFSAGKSKLDGLTEAQRAIYSMQIEFGNKLKQIQSKNKENCKLIESDYIRYIENKLAIRSEEEILLKQENEFKNKVDMILKSNSKTDIKLKAIERELKRATNLFPFYGYRQDIIDAVSNNDVLLIVGQTSSGKSTQIPQYLLESGIVKKKIVCTQPRKVAAQTLAKRIREEMLCPDSPLIRCNDKKMTPDEWRKNKLMFMTDRALLHELLNKKMKNYSCVIIDEAHERTVFTDILLCELKQLYKERQGSADPLKIIITSATINENLFRTYFDDCPVIRVPGRLYPVEVHWEKSEEKYVDQSVRKVVNLLTTRNKSNQQLTGDILVFLTNPEEIDSACHKLKSMLKHKSLKLENLEILPLHGKMSGDDQQKALNPIIGKTKVIFSSNIAETSVTINGVTTIIDSGRVKERTFDQNRNISLLKVNYISQSSSKQRRGRAGRTQPGECYNLYTLTEFEQFNISQPAEIFRSHLGSVLLQIILHSSKPLTETSLINYDLIEKPSPKDIQTQLKKLKDLGFIELSANMLRISKSGKIASQLYMEPSVSKMIIEGISNGIPSDILKVAAITTVSNIVFQRSKDNKGKDDISISKISASQKEGDLYSLYLLFDQFIKKKTKERSQFCKDNHLNFSAFNMALITLKDLEKSIKSLCPKENSFTNKSAEVKKKVILDSIVSGLFSNFAYYNGKSKNGEYIYKLMELNLEACLHPSSVIISADSPPPYVIFYELMRTEKLYMKNVTPIDIEHISKYNPSVDYSSIKKSTKIPYEKLVPKSYISQLRARGGELTEQLERETGVLVEVDDVNNVLRMELSESEKSKLDPIIHNFLQKLSVRVSKHLYEFIPAGQNIRSLVTSGLDVLNLVTSKEFVRLNFRISTDIKRFEDVKKQLENYNNIWEIWTYPNTTSSQKVEGYVTFTDHRTAQRVHDELKNESFIQLFPSALSENAKLEIDENVPFIQLRYYLTPCKGRAYVEFSSYQAALEASNILGNALGTCKVTHTKLSFDRLPNNFHEATLFYELHRRNISYSQIVFHRDECSYEVDSSVIAAKLHSLFTPFPGLEVMELIPVTEKESKKFIKALVKYNNKGSADNAIEQLQGRMFEGGSLQLHYKVDRITLPLNVYNSMKPVLDEVFRTIYYDHKIKVTFNEMKLNTNNSKIIKGNSGEFRFEMVSNLRQLEQAKKKLTDIIGHTTTRVPYSQKAHFQRKLDSIKKQVSDIYPDVLVSFESTSSSIKVYGSQRESAINTIKQLVSSSKVREIKVRYMKAIVGNGGTTYNEIKKSIKGLVHLNLKKKVIETDCSQDDFEKLKKLVEEKESKYTDSAGGEHSHECDICCNDIDPNCLTCCLHPCCQACLALQVDNFNIESGLLKCNTCQKELPFLDVLCSFDNDAKKLYQPCNILLEKYIARSRASWCYCNTCQSLSRIQGQSYSCIVCEKEYCLKCHKNSHLGPCIDVEALFEEYKRKHTKHCPKCQTTIEKNDGCHHMTCSSCQNHFCWRCGFSNSSSGPIYDHQSSCSGDQYF